MTTDPLADVKVLVTRKIDNYVRGFIAALERGIIKLEDQPGDCFACQFLPADMMSAWDNLLDSKYPFKDRRMLAWRKTAAQPANPLGVQHLLLHLHEHYYMASVFLNALREYDHADPQSIIIALTNPDTARRLRRTIRAMIKGYFMRRLDKLAVIEAGQTNEVGGLQA